MEVSINDKDKDSQTTKMTAPNSLVSVLLLGCSWRNLVLIREGKRKDQSTFFYGHEGSYPATDEQRKVYKQEVKFWFLYLSNK